jgi:hypothetical protein
MRKNHQMHDETARILYGQTLFYASIGTQRNGLYTNNATGPKDLKPHYLRHIGKVCLEVNQTGNSCGDMEISHLYQFFHTTRKNIEDFVSTFEKSNLMEISIKLMYDYRNYYYIGKETHWREKLGCDGEPVLLPLLAGCEDLERLHSGMSPVLSSWKKLEH